jgi:hypothetical protein
MTGRRMKKAAVRVGLAAALVTGLIGVLHAPFARPLLMKIGGCPVGKASAAEVEEGRMQAVRKTRGSVPAPSRPALGFALDGSVPEDVLAWAEKKGISCKEKREGMLLTCKDVPANVLPDRPQENGTIDEVSFAFRPRDRRLVNVTAMSFRLSPDEAARRMTASVDRVRPDLGAPAIASGDVTKERFANGGFVTATTTWSYSDYEAQMTATSFNGRGVALREQYLSASE